MGNPTRFPNGISTQAVGRNLGNFPLPDPTEACVDYEDFNQYVAGDWTVTNTTSHATIGLVAASSTVPAGGVVGLVGGGSSVNTDVAAIQATPLNFYFTSSQQVWFYTHLKLDVAANNLVMVGIGSSAATVAPSDGIYLQKVAGSAALDLVVRKSSTSTTVASVATLADATSVEVGFYYNGKDTVYAFVNEQMVGATTTLTNLPVSVAMGPFLAMKLAATAPTTAYLYSDFLLAAQDRAF